MSEIETAQTMQAAETMDIMKTHKKGITSSTLKIIAITSMMIDHIGAVILARMLLARGMADIIDQQAYAAFMEANAALYNTYAALRMIGRIAFPIFCFLLVQGFLHTHDLKKYLGRIFLFALISEIPFDLALSGKLFEWGYQNIFFTLFFGILAITGIKIAEEKQEWNIISRVEFWLLSVGLCVGAVMVIQSDYDVIGVLVIVVIYLLRRKKTLSVGIGCVLLLKIPAFISLIPVYFYNGERGKNIKWFFYLFYPVHIFLLYLISLALGLGQVVM